MDLSWQIFFSLRFHTTLVLACTQVLLPLLLRSDCSPNCNLDAELAKHDREVNVLLSRIDFLVALVNNEKSLSQSRDVTRLHTARPSSYLWDSL